MASPGAQFFAGSYNKTYYLQWAYGFPSNKGFADGMRTGLGIDPVSLISKKKA